MVAASVQPESDDWIEPHGEERLVSVVIPTCNRSGFVTETIRSILRQSYRPIEILVVDDGSTDRTPEAMESLQAELPAGIELTYLKQVKAGAPAARNRGARMSRGQFIVFMDDDDLFEQDFFSAHVDAFASHPTANLSYGHWIRFMKAGGGYNLLDCKGKMPASARTPWEGFLQGWEILLQACMMQRSLVSEVGPWRLDLKKSQDLDYKARLLGAESCEVVESEKSQAYYRLHKQSITGTMTPEKLQSYLIAFDDVEKIAKRRSDFEQLNSTFADYLWSQSYWATGVGEHDAAWQLLQRAKEYDANVSKRNGSLPSRILAYCFLDRISSPLLYSLFRIKMMISPTPEPFLDHVQRLPGSNASF